MNSGTVAVYLFVGLLAHGIGDYVFQSHWMAQEKLKRWSVASLHGALYAVPFTPLVLLPAWAHGNLAGGLAALVLVVGGTHAALDRLRAAPYVIWIMNQALSPLSHRRSWAECRKTGYPPEVPEWLAVLLKIIVDNLIHILINSLVIIWAVRYA